MLHPSFFYRKRTPFFILKSPHFHFFRIFLLLFLSHFFNQSMVLAQPLACIGGVVCQDDNENGELDANEVGIAGALIQLESLDDPNLSQQTISDNNGAYEFCDLPPGNYHVSLITGTSNFIITSVDEYNLVLDGTDLTDVNFCLALPPPTGTIQGHICYDFNQNGMFDVDEDAGIPEVIIVLYLPDGTTLEIISDEWGYYLFPDLAYGDYILEVLPPQDIGGPTTEPFHQITLNDDVTIVEIDVCFLMNPDVGSIGNEVILDLNGNGVKDVNEPGIPHATVTLSDGTNFWLGNTNANGFYHFANLLPNTYTVMVSAPAAGLVATAPTTLTVNLAMGQVENNVDFFFQPDFGEGNFLCGQIAGTCFSGLDSNLKADPSGYVLSLMDVRDKSGATLGQNWSPTMYHHNDWTARRMGQIFGLAIDNQQNIYVTASAIYGPPTIYSLTNPQFGPAGGGGIYKIHANSWAVSNFASLPNSGTGLGNIAFDKTHNQFFVTNMEDGKIYRLDMNGNTLSTFTPMAARSWGIAVHDNRVYFGTWTADMVTSGVNEIYSVALDVSGNFSGTDNLEITMPAYNANNYSNPVSDISFSSAGKMLIAERSMNNDWANVLHNWPGHHARILEFTPTSPTTWSAPKFIYIGNYTYWNSNHANSAGGIDYGYGKWDSTTNQVADCDSLIWGSGDALRFGGTNPSVLTPPNDYVYGFAGMPASGNVSGVGNTNTYGPDWVKTSSYYIDADGITTSIDKSEIGDVETFRCCAPCDKKCLYKIRDTTIVCEQDTICIWLDATQPVDPGIIGLDYCLNYDPNYMTPTGNAKLGDVVLDCGNLNQPNDADVYLNINNPVGEVRTSIYYNGLNTFTQKAGSVICIEFAINTSVVAPGMTIPLSACEVRESYALFTKNQCADPGELKVEEATRGRLIFWDDFGRPLDNTNPASVTSIRGVDENCDTLTLDASHTDPEGCFTHNPVNGDKIVINRDIAPDDYNVPGAGNCFNVMPIINGMDCVYLGWITTCQTTGTNFSYFNGKQTPNAFQMIAGDVNMSDVLSAGDISLIQNRIVQRICEFPQVWNYDLLTVTPLSPYRRSLDWRFVDEITAANSPDYTPHLQYPNCPPHTVAGSGYYRDDVPDVPECLPTCESGWIVKCIPIWQDNVVWPVEVIDLPIHGEIEFQEEGFINYIPEPGFIGLDSLSLATENPDEPLVLNLGVGIEIDSPQDPEDIAICWITIPYNDPLIDIVPVPVPIDRYYLFKYIDCCEDKYPYHSVLLGDLTGSWTTTDPLKKAAAPIGKLRFDCPNTIKMGDNLYYIPISYDSEETIYAVDFSLNYNKKYVKIVGIERNDSVQGMESLAHNDVDEKSELWFTSYTLDGSQTEKPILYLAVKLTENTTIEQVGLDIVQAYLNGERAEAEFIRHYVIGIDEPIESSIQMITFPSPVQDVLQVHLTDLAPNNRYQLQITDLLGRNLRNLTISNTNTTSKQSISVIDLPKAIYMLSLRDQRGQLMHTTKFVKQ